MEYSYADDRSIFGRNSVAISIATIMIARMCQFYRKCIGFRKTEFETSILDSNYNNDDFGETILGRNAAIRINIRRHIFMLHSRTVIDVLAHFLENRFFDHVNTFFLPWFDFDK